jgi:hypothetical protein
MKAKAVFLFFRRGNAPLSLRGREEISVKIVIIRSPRLIAPLLARLFGVSKKKGS